MWPCSAYSSDKYGTLPLSELVRRVQNTDGAGDSEVGRLDPLFKSQEELDRLGLRFDCRTKVRNLSVAESQMTEIAKCLTIGAKVIIMDEPTAA